MSGFELLTFEENVDDDRYQIGASEFIDPV